MSSIEKTGVASPINDFTHWTVKWVKTYGAYKTACKNDKATEDQENDVKNLIYKFYWSISSENKDQAKNIAAYNEFVKNHDNTH